MRYEFKNHLFAKRCAIVLAPLDMEVWQNGIPSYYPYYEVKQVRMRTRLDSRWGKVYECTIVFKDSNKVVFSNYSFEDFFWRDLSTEYGQFIDKLHNRLRDNSACDFKGGMQEKDFWLHLSATLAVLFPIFFFLLYDQSQSYEIGVLKLLLIVFLMVHTIRFFKKNLPSDYLPTQIPDCLRPNRVSWRNFGRLLES